MAGNLGKWRSKREPISKFGPSDGGKKDTAPWRRDCGTISMNLDGIWEMSI
jgi:hypothetical protein